VTPSIVDFKAAEPSLASANRAVFLRHYQQGNYEHDTKSHCFGAAISG
jgi:hypothetical protein